MITCDCPIKSLGLSCDKCPNIRKEYHSGYFNLRVITDAQFKQWAEWFQDKFVELREKEWRGV